MTEPFDVYADQFQVVIGPWGSSLNFSVSSPHPPGPGQMPQVTQVGTIRMSAEHLKALTFLIRRQVIQIEQNAHITYPVPVEVLNGLGISPEDWNAFWS